jgi:hypothetical protein
MVAVTVEGWHVVGRQDAIKVDVFIRHHAGEHARLAFVVPGFLELV